MLLVSCRRDFTSDRLFADDILLRDYANPADITRFTDLGVDALLRRAEGRHVLVLVHGYRNPFKNLAAAYADLARNLSNRNMLDESVDATGSHYGLMVGFAWPGFTTRTLGFFAARPWANKAADYLQRLIGTVRRAARSVDIQTHSLGAQVALQAITTDNTLWVDNLMLTAPAVDNESLQPGEDFHESLDNCNRVFVYHSKNDPVLKTYVVASFDRALGARGPQDKAVTLDRCRNVYVIDCQEPVREHSDYRKTPEYYTHWDRVLNNDPLERYEAILGVPAAGVDLTLGV
jgi:esterase/lipase superfamily enzyme